MLLSGASNLRIDINNGMNNGSADRRRHGVTEFAILIHARLGTI